MSHDKVNNLLTWFDREIKYYFLLFNKLVIHGKLMYNEIINRDINLTCFLNIFNTSYISSSGGCFNFE